MGSGRKAWLCGVGRSSISPGVAGLDRVPRPWSHAAVERHGAGFDQLLQVAARELGHQRRQRAVEPLAVLRRRRSTKGRSFRRRGPASSGVLEPVRARRRQGVGRYNRFALFQESCVSMLRAKLSVVPAAGAVRRSVAGGLLLDDRATRPRTGARTRSTPKPRTNRAPAPTTRRSRCSRSSKAAPPARRWRSRPSWKRPTPSTRRGDQAQALATLDRFIKLHPASPAIDYALYLKGVVNFNDNLGMFSLPVAPGPVRARPEGRQGIVRVVQGTGDPLPRFALHARRAGAHDLHRQFAGAVRSARGALLLQPRRLRGRDQPRAERADRLPATCRRWKRRCSSWCAPTTRWA